MNIVKSLFVSLSLLSISLTSWAVEFPVPKLVKVNERVQVLLGPTQHANEQNQGYMINSTVIIGDKGVILVDSGGTDEVGQFIRNQIKKITRKPITHVINTHSHADHYLGNIAFPKATIVSSEKCRESVVQTGGEWLQLMENMVGRKFPNTKPIPASMTYPALSKTEVTLNGVRMVLWVPLASHTDSDLMVYLPDDKALIAGDILVNGIVPTMQDGIVKNWISVLEEIEAIDADVYVPGHGPLMKLSQVKLLRNSISRFYAGVREGYRKNLGMGEIRGHLNLSEWEGLERAYVIGRNIDRAYLEIEQDFF